MESKKSLHDLRAHLASFVPEYPLKKGYIAQLLLDEANKICDVVKKVKTVVLTSEPDKFINENTLRKSIDRFNSVLKQKRRFLAKNWSLLSSLFLEPFHVTTKVLTDSDSLPLQPPLPSTPKKLPSCSHTPVTSPSPKKMRRDCENCYTKMRTFVNLSKANVRLRQELKDLRIQYKRDLAITSQKGVFRLIKRKENTIAAWKSKYRSLKVYKSQLVMVCSKLQIALDEIKTLKEKEQEYKSRIEELQNILDKEHGPQIVENVDMLEPTETLKQELDETERNINGTYLAAEIKQEPDYEIPRNYEATVPDKYKEIKQELDYVITRNVDTPEPDQDEGKDMEPDHVTVRQVEQHLPSHAKEIKQEEDYDAPVHFDLTNHTSMSASATTACQSLLPPAYKSLLPPPSLSLLPTPGLSRLPPALMTQPPL